MMFSRFSSFDKLGKRMRESEEARKVAEEKKTVANVYGDDIANKAGNMTNVESVIQKEDLGKRSSSLFSEDIVMNTSGSEKTKKNEKALLGNSRGTLFGN